MMLAPAAAARPKAANDLLQAMNEARAQHGVPHLRASTRLERAASSYSLDLLRRNTLAHDGFVRRMQRAGVRGPFVGENLAWGVGASASATVIVSTWLASPAHRANLLNPRFRVVGLGHATGAFSGRANATIVVANFAGTRT